MRLPMIAMLLLAGCANANAPIDSETGKPDPTATHSPGLGNWDELSGPEKVLRALVAVPALIIAVPVLAVAEAVQSPEFAQAVGDTMANTSVYSDTVHTRSGTYDVTGSCVYSSCSSTVKKR